MQSGGGDKGWPGFISLTVLSLALVSTVSADIQCLSLCSSVQRGCNALNFWRSQSVVSACTSSYNVCKSGCDNVVSTTSAITGYFDSTVSPAMQTAFDSLSTSVQTGFKDASTFASVAVADLQKVSPALLASAKSVSQMTVIQLKGVTSVVSKMTATELTNFANHVSGVTLKDSMETLGAVATWTYDQSYAVVSRIEKSDIYGDAKTWSLAQVHTLGHLITGVEPAKIVHWSNQILIDAKVSTKLVQAQLGPLAQRTGNMALSEFKTFYAQINSTQLKGAMGPIGKTVVLADAHVSHLYGVLVQKNFFGNLSAWTSETVELMGDLIGPLVLHGKVSQFNKETFKAMGIQIIKGMILSKTFGDAVLYEKISILGEIIIAVSGLFGQDAKNWTKEAVAFAGPALVAYLQLSAIPGDVIMAAIPGIIENGFDWSTVKGMGKDFAIRVQDTDIYGAVSNWTSVKIVALGNTIGAALRANDIPMLKKEAVLDGLATFKSAADAGVFDADQLQALAIKLAEVYGKPAVEWTSSEIKQAGNIVLGVTVSDLKNMASIAIAAIPEYTVKLMSPAQLNGMARKLGDLTDAAKSTIYGQKVIKLTAEAKAQIFHCVAVCLSKFIDVVVTFKNDPAQVTKDALKAMMTTAVNISTATVTFLGTIKQSAVEIAVRIDLGSITTAQLNTAKASVETSLATANSVVGDITAISAVSFAVDPLATADVPPTSAASVYSPSFLVAAAAIVCMLL